MSQLFHPTAIVDPSAEISDGVEIGPYAVIESDVKLGRGCRIAAHAIIRRFAVLEAEVSVDSFAVVGGLPQDFSFDPEVISSVLIGRGAVLREGVTVHRSTAPEGVTRIGANCFLMGNSHIAHDCELEDNVVLANNAMLAGHVHVGEGAFLGGGCGIHQFVTIGSLVMVAGNASVTNDVPHYVTVAERSMVTGLNLVGLKRKMPSEVVSDLRACYKSIYLKPGDPKKHAAESTATTPEGRRFLDFIRDGKRRRLSRSRIQLGRPDT